MSVLDSHELLWNKRVPEGAAIDVLLVVGIVFVGPNAKYVFWALWDKHPALAFLLASKSKLPV